jgi:hypothetical protein
MSDETKYHIIRPKNIMNGTNACWINAPLFASSAHEIIILQHFILDNSRLVQGELDLTSIFIEKFLNVNRLNNLPWNEETYLNIYNILSDIAYGNYFFNKEDPVPQYGFYGPGDIILQKFMGMITKNFNPRASELCYLKTETRVCRNKQEFNSLIENTDGNTKFELISFIASVCTDSVNNLPQKPPTHMNTKFKKELAKKVLKVRDMSHWNAYVLTNNGKWRYFNALKGKIKDINYDEIFNCSDDKGMHVCCIYIDREKFNKIMNLSKVFNTFKDFMKYFNESKSKSNIDIAEFYKLSNNFIQEYFSMQNSPIGILDPNAGPVQGPNPKPKSKSIISLDKLSDVDNTIQSFDIFATAPDSFATSSSDVSHIITKSMQKEIDILIKKNINLLKIEDIRKILIKLKVKIPLGTIDIRGLLINTILKIKK